jgi:hypothetical protein
MKAESFLLTLALLGGGIAGFSGLIVALPREAKGSAWKINEVAGIKLLLEYSFGLIFLSLVPFVINEITPVEMLNWKFSAYAALVFIVFETAIQFYRLLKAYGSGSPPGSPFLLFVIVAPGIVLFLVYMMSNVALVAWLIAWYQIVLLWIVAAIGLQFWFFIKRHTEPPQGT